MHGSVGREGLDVTVLPQDYQRIIKVLADLERAGEGSAICRQLASLLDLEPVPARIEGVRSKAKCRAARLARRGHPGLLQRRGFARWRLMTIVSLAPDYGLLRGLVARWAGRSLVNGLFGRCG